MGSDAGRALRRLIIVVVVVVGLLVAVDRVGKVLAERFTADTIESSQHLDHRPGVDVTGFPFLTQFVTGHYGHVEITADDVPVGAGGVHVDLSQVRLDLYTVTVSHDFHHITAKRAHASATLGYAQLGDLLHLHVAYRGHGRISASRSVTIAGQTVRAAITARPVVTRGVLSFTKATINGAGELGAEVTNLLQHSFDVSVPLHGIPFDVRVRSLHAGADGIEIGLTGAGLTYSR